MRRPYEQTTNTDPGRATRPAPRSHEPSHGTRPPGQRSRGTGDGEDMLLRAHYEHAKEKADVV